MPRRRPPGRARGGGASSRRGIVQRARCDVKCRLSRVGSPRPPGPDAYAPQRESRMGADGGRCQGPGSARALVGRHARLGGGRRRRQHRARRESTRSGPRPRPSRSALRAGRGAEGGQEPSPSGLPTRRPRRRGAATSRSRWPDSGPMSAKASNLGSCWPTPKATSSVCSALTTTERLKDSGHVLPGHRNARSAGAGDRDAGAISPAPRRPRIGTGATSSSTSSAGRASRSSGRSSPSMR